MAKAKDIVKNFDVIAFRDLLVGKRNDGQLYAVDGQTRRHAALDKNLKMSSVWCSVFNSDGPEHEAEIFRKANGQTGISLRDKVKALVAEKDPETLKMKEIVENAGFELKYYGTTTWPKITTFKSLIVAMENGTLEDTLDVIGKAYGRMEDGEFCGATSLVIQLPMLPGIEYFIRKFGDLIDLGDLVCKLRKASVLDIITEASKKKLSKGSHGIYCAKAIFDYWNKGESKKNRLKWIK